MQVQVPGGANSKVGSHQTSGMMVLQLICIFPTDVCWHACGCSPVVFPWSPSLAMEFLCSFAAQETGGDPNNLAQVSVNYISRQGVR
jgi:hypothetical protein